LQHVCLGYDYAAEHEFGIQGLKSLFGIDSDEAKYLLSLVWEKFIGKKQKFGIERRAITVVPENILFSGEFIKQKTKMYFLGTGTSWRNKDGNEKYLRELAKKEAYIDSEINGWWDEKSFLIASPNKNIITQLREAFEKKDIAIWLSGSKNPFAGSGLVIAIKSNIENGNLKSLEDGDKDNYAVIKAASKSRIVEKLKAANKEYYALSPKWLKSIEKASDSKYEIVFWLNPYDQDRYNFGWFTVEELEMWIKNKGPVLKKQNT
jgi:hypothetical protein